jgi:preprotein translocase subunit SecG
MYGFVMFIHLMVCMGLIGVVLLQSGKGGGLAGGAFGGSAQTVFGGRGATDFITRATMVLGAAFFITSLTLSLMGTAGSQASRSLLQEEARRAGGGPAQVPPATAPALPGGATSPAGAAAPGGATAPTQGPPSPGKPAGAATTSPTLMPPKGASPAPAPSQAPATKPPAGAKPGGP